MTHSTDIVIHINESLDNNGREKLTSTVCQFSGVLSVSLKERTPHLMIIGFNPLKTKSLEVLNNIKNTGMHAQLVSWL